MIILEVNKSRRLELMQLRPDGPVIFVTRAADLEAEALEFIAPGDMVTMLNWYRYQKMIGNDALLFKEDEK